MIKSKIQNIADQFRAGILSIPRKDFPWNSSMGVSEFPAGCCGDSAQTLATYLHSQLDIICNYVHGQRGGNDNEIGSHAWLEYEGLVIDITADQFNYRGYEFDPVFVSERDDWYKSFELQITEDGRHTSLKDRGSLDAVYAKILSKL